MCLNFWPLKYYGVYNFLSKWTRWKVDKRSRVGHVSHQYRGYDTFIGYWLFQKLRKIHNIHSGCFVVVVVKVKLVLSRIELRILCDMYVLSDMHVSNCANILNGSSWCYEIDVTFQSRLCSWIHSRHPADGNLLQFNTCRSKSLSSSNNVTF